MTREESKNFGSEVKSAQNAKDNDKVDLSAADEKEGALEALRDLCVEVEAEEGEGGEDEGDREIVRVCAGTAFARAGEIEEALESLGVTEQGSANLEYLEAVGVRVYIYLSINRADLARKEFDRAKVWADDDLLLQMIETSIGLVTGKDSYSNPQSFYNEQIGNPTLNSPRLLTARAVTRLLRGEINEAKSDLEEVKSQGGEDGESAAAYVVAAGLSGKTNESEELWSKFINDYPTHPLVKDVGEKAGLFDEYSQNYEVPPLAVAVA